MRTARITLAGKEYPMCFSARVVRACSERYGGIEHLDEKMNGDAVQSLDEAIWLLSQMMDAGVRYAKINGDESAEAPTADDLYDLFGMDDFAGLKDKIAETITNGNKTTVEAEAPKNGKATPGR